MYYCGLHWTLKTITIVTTAATLSNSVSYWPGSDIRTGKTYMSSTLQPHFKDNGSHLSRHKQIIWHIKWREPHVFPSSHHSYHSHHDAKAVVHRICCYSPVTICHSVITLSCPQLHCARHMLAWCAHLARHKLLQHQAPSSGCLGARMLLPSWLPILAWLNLCSCLTLNLNSCGTWEKQHCPLIRAVTPTNQTKS